jgi:outer membrane protein OmpA-like peptidoglycan-associated protein
MRRAATALVWLLVIGIGTAGSELYKMWVLKDRVPLSSRVEDYRKKWNEALADVKDLPQPNAEEAIANAALGQQAMLSQKLGKIDKEFQKQYTQKTDQLMDDLVNKFKADWDSDYDAFDDTPSVDEFIKIVHESHRKRLQDRLAIVDDGLKKKFPRTKLALDSFSGYSVFRSEEFRAKLMARSNIKLHLADDKADYKKRIHALKSGETPLAVFTLDALINNSALEGDPPATVVMVIDETRGADAMVSYKSALPSIDAMNRSDLKVVLTPDSPSETLARLVRSEFKLPKVPKECFVAANDAEDVYKRFKEADPKDPKAFVLWEPYVSKLLKEHRDAHILIDSSRFSGYIVDVLVVQKDYLKKNPGEVDAIVQAYYEAAATHLRSPQDLAKLVQADSEKLAEAKKLPEPLTAREAEQVVGGIWWKTMPENYAHFGLAPAGADVQPLEEMVKNISNVLIKTKAIGRAAKASDLLDKEVCARLQAAKFDPGIASLAQQPRLSAADDDTWNKLQPVGTLDTVEANLFNRGQADLATDSEAVLGEVAHKLKTFPQYYLAIHGHAQGATREDRELAKARADEVLKWLKEKGGVEAQRMRAFGLEQGASAEKGQVTFTLLEAPR